MPNDFVAPPADNPLLREVARMLVPRQPTRTHLFFEFRKQRPPVFQGDTNPKVAEAWLRQTRKMLNVMGIQGDADRVDLATYQLEGEADNWWNMIKDTRNTAIMTWAQFEELFLEKYFPMTVKEDMIQEFLSLRQGGMTVAQYVARFEELARHASRFVGDDRDKARKFEWGLDFSLREKVVPLRLTSYQGVVDAALGTERERNDAKRVLSQKKTGVPTVEGPVRNTGSFVAQKPYDRPF